MKTRKGYGKGLGMGYKNLMPMDSHIHSLSAKGVKSLHIEPTYVPRGSGNNPYGGKRDLAYKIKEWGFVFPTKESAEKYADEHIEINGEIIEKKNLNVKGKKQDSAVCPECSGKVTYNFTSDRWECASCRYSDMFKPEKELNAKGKKKSLYAKVPYTYSKLSKRQQKIWDKLVHSGASDLFAGYVLAFPDSHIANDFMQGYSGGGFSQALFKGDFIDAMFRADLENTRKLKDLMFPINKDENFKGVFANIPSALKKEK